MFRFVKRPFVYCALVAGEQSIDIFDVNGLRQLKGYNRLDLFNVKPMVQIQLSFLTRYNIVKKSNSSKKVIK